jgi:hypothetical protein
MKSEIHLDILGNQPSIGNIIVFKAPYSSKLQLGTIHSFTTSGCPSVVTTNDDGEQYIISVKKEFLIHKYV